VPQHVAFLRGINLGNRRVSGRDLRACFEAMGFEDVATFRASGNVIFAADREPLPKMTARIEAGLGDSLGYQVSTFLRTASDVEAIAAHEPFPAGQVEASRGKLQVALLSAEPTAKARKEALAHSTDEDRLALDGRELYWLPSGGISDSALDLRTIEGTVGPTTIRTKNTVQQIAAKYFAAE
jgi:uncharacterized protein (DUF1697 family)